MGENYSTFTVRSVIKLMLESRKKNNTQSSALNSNNNNNNNNNNIVLIKKSDENLDIYSLIKNLEMFLSNEQYE